MTSIQACSIPDQALLARYAGLGGYADCYVTEVTHPVSHAQYVEAFYTGAVFKLERLLLAWFVSMPSTDAQAKELARGELEDFAAWHVEARSANELLMCDRYGRTRSWLMVAPFQSGGVASTRLYFGSAVVPVDDKGTGQPRLGFSYDALLGFHKLYSRMLLYATRTRLARPAAAPRR
jgi:hypothetical protein